MDFGNLEIWFYEKEKFMYKNWSTQRCGEDECVI